MLKIENLTYRIDGRILFDAASVTVGGGQHVGLVGRNGSGKTTLFRIILNELAPDGGEIAMPTRWRIGAIAQEAPDGDITPLEAVLAADKERMALLSEAETATDPNRIAHIHARLTDTRAHAAPARAASILAGLGFDEPAQGRGCGTFSGGMRMRVALAAALFLEPDLLLLDEPTNHLDLESTLWLEGYLKTYPGTILLISHDRQLLNRSVEHIIHLEHRQLTHYTGSYDTFERTRRMRLEHLSAQAGKQERQRAHMQAFVDRFRAKATKARQAQSRLKALEKMETIELPVEESTPPLTFPSPTQLPSPILSLEHVDAGYDGVPVLRDLSLRIDMDDRIALLGQNGNGKSTLAKLLAGRMEPLSGIIQRSSHLRIGYFAQHQTEELDTTLTGLEEMAQAAPGTPPQKLRSHLGRFGFVQKKSETKISDMSGGEKARLLLARMAWHAPHILLLDEPTNHLDIDSRRALLDALNVFEGAVVLITHDPYLVDLAADRLWLVADGTCRPFEGDMQDYRRLLAEGRRQEPATRQTGGDGAINRKDQRRASADARKATAALRREVKELEGKIEKLSKEKSRIEQELADPAVYQNDAGEIAERQKRLHAAITGISKAEERWLALQDLLEEAS